MRAVVERDGRHRIARVLVNPVYVGCREEMPCRAGANGEQDGSSGPQRPPHQLAAPGGDLPDPVVGAAHERCEARQVGALLEDAACPPQALQFEEVFAVLLRLLQPREEIFFLLLRSLPGKVFLYDSVHYNRIVHLFCVRLVYNPRAKSTQADGNYFAKK